MLRHLLKALTDMPTGVTASGLPPRPHDPGLLDRLQALSPAAFEEWTADRLRELGYAVHRTGRSGDHGIDLLATRWGEMAIVQCKRYTTAVVGEEVVGRLYGSMVDRRADRAFLVTTSRLSAPARRWIGTKPIEIWDADRLLAIGSGPTARLPDSQNGARPQRGWRQTPPIRREPRPSGKPPDRLGKPNSQIRGKGPDRRGKTE
jgi:hypothetical protein